MGVAPVVPFVGAPANDGNHPDVYRAMQWLLDATRAARGDAGGFLSAGTDEAENITLTVHRERCQWAWSVEFHRTEWSGDRQWCLDKAARWASEERSAYARRSLGLSTWREDTSSLVGQWFDRFDAEGCSIAHVYKGPVHWRWGCDFRANDSGKFDCEKRAMADADAWLSANGIRSGRDVDELRRRGVA